MSYSKATSLIGEQLAFNVNHGHEDHVGFVVGGSLFMGDHVVGFLG